MRNLYSFFEDVKTIASRDPETILYKVMPYNLMRLLALYFRLEVEGLENVPRKGAAIIAPNHSGFAGFDYLMLAYTIYGQIRRVPRILAHRLYFATKWSGATVSKFGFVEARTDEGLKQLQKNNLLILFPEGEDGNFKPTSERYALRPFHKGFIRMAIEQNCPVIPTVILGAEESHLNLKTLKLDRFMPGLKAPLPLNLLPLPSKWKIVFLPPIQYPYTKEALHDSELLEELASETQDLLQIAIRDELAKRGSAFF